MYFWENSGFRFPACCLLVLVCLQGLCGCTSFNRVSRRIDEPAFAPPTLLSNLEAELRHKDTPSVAQTVQSDQNDPDEGSHRRRLRNLRLTSWKERWAERNSAEKQASPSIESGVKPAAVVESRAMDSDAIMRSTSDSASTSGVRNNPDLPSAHLHHPTLSPESQAQAPKPQAQSPESQARAPESQTGTPKPQAWVQWHAGLDAGFIATDR